MKRLIDFSSRFRILKGGKVSLVFSAFLGGAVIASAAPSGGTVTSGDATISQNGAVTNINQSTQKASINWNDFSIKANETVNFNQPNSSSITLNRVVGNEKSIIDGALNANGQVWILNSNGILFNSSAKVNTAGILATTAELSDSDFQNGNYNFKNSSKNSVINLGTIEVANSGYVVLASNELKNAGTIKAVKGKVHLVGADEYTLNLNGNSIVNLLVNKGVLDAMVENSGTIIADGGEVYLTTNAVNELLRGVVNNTGIIEANSLDGLTGKVEVFAHGGTANVSGTIEAKDGFVETSGKEFKFNGAKIEAGEWLIDPVNVTIDSTLAGAIEIALGSGDVTITTDGGNTPNTSSGESGTDGNINVNSEISWNNHTLKLSAAKDININADMTATGTANLALEYGLGAVAAANTAQITTTNAKVYLPDGFHYVTKLGSDGTSKPYTVISSQTSLQNMILSANYALGGDITASGAFTSLGQFSGSFDGLGHTISNLTVSKLGGAGNVGLFSKTTAAAIIRNIGIESGTITSDGWYTGALVGSNSGLIYNSYSKANVSSTEENTGGLVGLNSGASSIISKSYATGNVTGKINTGGLVGKNEGTISQSYASGGTVTGSGNGMGGLVGTNINTINTSYAVANIIGKNLYYIGGLVANSSGGTILNSYATGNISGGNNYAGGLVGISSGTSSITNSYASVTIQQTDGGLDGGLYGVKQSGTMTVINSFFDKDATGLVKAYASDAANPDLSASAKTTTDMQTLTTFSSPGWIIGGAATGAYPTLTFGGTTIWTINPITLVSYTLSAINNGDKYSGSEYSLNTLWNSPTTIFGGLHNDWLYNTDYVFSYAGGTITGFTNAGTYSNISVDVIKAGFDEQVSGSTLGSFIIGKKDITAITGITASNKTYDGLNSATLVSTGAGFTGIVGGDDLTVSSATGTFDTKDVGTEKTVSISGLILGGASVANYNLASTVASTTANITSKALTITGLTSNNKVYDGTNTATISNWGSVTTGVGSETLVLNNGTASFTDKNVGTNKTVTASGYSLSNGNNGGLSSNYVLSSTSATTNADIDKKPLEFTINKVYDGTGNISASNFTSFGILADDDGVSIQNATGVATTAQINAGVFTSLTSNPYTFNNFDNYTLTGATVNGTVSPRPISIIANNASKTYGEVDSTLTYTVGLGGLVGGDTLAGSLARVAGENAGTYNINDISGLSNSNYNIILQTAGTFTVNKKALTITGLTASNKVYDGTNTATISNWGSVTTGVGSETLVLNNGTASFTDKNVGTNKTVTASGYSLSNGNNGGLASNYTVASASPTTTANVTEKPFEFTINKVYDGTGNISASNFTSFGAVGGDAVSIQNHTAVATTAQTNVGLFNSLLTNPYTFNNAINYTMSGATVNGAILQRPISIIVADASKMYGDSDPVFSYTLGLGGLIGADTLTGNVRRVVGENGGTYSINNLSGLSNPNYNILLQRAGIFTIIASEPKENNIRDIITPISNTLVLNNFNPKPRVDVNKPSVKTPENNSVNIASQPIAGNGNKLVTMSELKETKTEENSAGNVNQDFMVPLGDNSTIQLVNAGVNLPEGVEQLFFVANTDNQEN